MNEHKIALLDFFQSLKQYRLWLYLANLEIKQKYRRSVIGPWWITISMAVFIIAMSIVFSRIFKEDLSLYLTNFCSGFLFWSFFSTTISEAAETFRNNASFIRQINLPYSIYILKHLTKQILTLAHNMIVYLLICLFLKFSPGINILFFFPGFVLFVVNLFWLSFVISILCTRYRDMVPIINSCIQIAFFITPISWSSTQLNPDSLILKLNPLVYLIDIVKAPLIGDLPLYESWVFTIFSAIIGMFAVLILFSRKKRLIAYWVN